MKTKKNIVFFIAGIIAAALLWHFYLGPKYNIKRGDKETLDILLEADKDALNRATESLEGEVLFNTASDKDGTAEIDDGGLSSQSIMDAGKPSSEGESDFASMASKPEDVYEQMAKGDKRGGPRIVLENRNVTVNMPDVDEASAATEAEGEDLLQNSRITLIGAPVKPHIIRNDGDYSAFKKGRKGNFEKIDFTKDMIVFLESDTNMSNGFFEIAEVLPQEDMVLVEYRVNIIGSSEKKDIMPYKVLKQTDKPVKFKQIK